MRRNTIIATGGLVLVVLLLAKIGWLPQMKAIWTALPAIVALSSFRLSSDRVASPVAPSVWLVQSFE